METNYFYEGTYEKYQGYISNLYAKKSILERNKFVEQTGWSDFIPVIDDDAARFLQLMLQIKRPMKILEIGTSLGFSTTSMALVAKQYGATITTMEFDQKVAQKAKENFKRAGVEKQIQIKIGDAKELIREYPDSYFDFIFQDVDKRLYPLMLDECIRTLKPQGILIGDDALFPVMELEARWQDQIAPMQEFNKRIVNLPEMESTLLPIGDGMIVAVKR